MHPFCINLLSSPANVNQTCKRLREKTSHREDGSIGARVLWETGGGIGETRQGDGSCHVLLVVVRLAATGI